MAIIGILKEPEGENRVVALPEIAAQLVKMNFQVLVESGAGSTTFVFLYPKPVVSIPGKRRTKQEAIGRFV